MLALSACKPTVIIEEPEPAPQLHAENDPVEDPLIEQEAVREAMRAYAAALIERDVEAAESLVVADTFRLYEQLRVTALNATREQLEELDLLRVVMVLQIRSKLDRAALEALDGRGLFGFAVTEGLVGDEIAALSLDEIFVDIGTLAQIRIEGTPVVWLRKTGGDHGELRWRVDIPRMINEVGPQIEAMAKDQIAANGKARTAYALAELGSDEFIDIEVLDGPLESVDEDDGAPAPAPAP